MQTIDKPLANSPTELSCFSECTENAAELVIFELVVPDAAKVRASRRQLEVAKLVLQEVTSTARAKIITQLRVNNTAQSTAWCITATLAAPQPARRPLAY